LLTLSLLVLITGCKSEGAFTESAAVLQRIDLSISTIQTRGTSQFRIAKGNTQRFVAIGHFSDGSSRNLDDSLDVRNWQSSDEYVGLISESGTLIGVGAGETEVTVSKDGITSNKVSVHVNNAEITSITVTPSPVSVAKGQTQQLVATATYSDNTSAEVSNSVTWSSTDNKTAMVTPDGLLSGVSIGSTLVTALKDGVTSNIINVESTSAALTGITITPSPVLVAKGQSEQLMATATYSDGTSSDVSNSVTWSPIDTAAVTISRNGLLTGIDLGSTAVIASQDDIISQEVGVKVTNAVITDVTITPSLFSMAKGQTKQLTAIATYSDGSSSDVSSSVIWKSINNSTAIVTPSGLLSGVGVGSTEVIACIDGVPSNKVSVEVSNAVVTSIAITPTTVFVAKGQTQQLSATATYSDGTSSDVSNSVTWDTVDAVTAIITPSGLLSGVNIGATTVTAFKDDVTSKAVNVDVTSAVITSIAVSPSSAFLAKGQTQQLVATATFSDGTLSDISSSVAWTTVDPTIAIVTPSGLLSGVSIGTTSVTAVKDGAKSTARVEISSAVIAKIELTPSTVYLSKDQTKQLSAIAIYSDNTSSDVSSSVTWRPADTKVITVTSTGLLSSVNAGTSTVTAFKDSVSSNSISIDVCRNLAGPCLDIFATDNGKLFTNSPSKAFLDSIAGSPTNGYFTENNHYGPVGDFYLFSWNNANALCDKYNTRSIAGRTNWRLTTLDELKAELFDVYGNMFASRGWPVYKYYWSATDRDNFYHYVTLSYGGIHSYDPVTPNYASCVSLP
jgi:uncharacterized protein YjdB